MVGDELEDGQGSEYRILAVCGELVAISIAHGKNAFRGWYTMADLNDCGYTLVTPQPEVVEVNGKRYDREKLAERLRDLPEVE